MQNPTASTRRREYEGPAIFTHGFRPFFLGASAFAGLAMPVWIAMLWGRLLPRSEAMDPLFWHAHEMIFGYLSAVVAGFLLTAVPNWTGRLPVTGRPLAWLFLLWACGRVGLALAAGGVFSVLLAKLVDSSFLVAMTLLLLREIVVGRNWRNIPVVVLLGFLATANILMNFAGELGMDLGIGERLSLGAVMVMIGLIGGRIVPSFTRNWLAMRNPTRLPAAFALFDRVALAITATAAAFWFLFPLSPVTGGLLLVASLFNVIRLSRWCGLATLAEPLLFILHVGFGWLCFAMLLLGGEILIPNLVSLGSALHALTAGAIGTMTLAVMSRASLGHTGRRLTSTKWIDAIYLLVTLGAALRVSAPWFGSSYAGLLTAGGILWASAFLLFVVVFAPMLTTPRQTRPAAA